MCVATCAQSEVSGEVAKCALNCAWFKGCATKFMRVNRCVAKKVCTAVRVSNARQCTRGHDSRAKREERPRAPTHDEF